MKLGVAVFLFTVLLVGAHLSYSQYWFQSGVIANGTASNNSGISVQIETIYGQNITNGSIAFWVGENLQNGAFVQVGYAVESKTGEYPNNCTSGGCSSKIYMEAGKPYWFFEYFRSTNSEQSFYGGFSNVSLGSNGTFNTYSVSPDGTLWKAYLNGKLLGSVNAGVPDSGNNAPYVVGEYANASTNQTYMIPVRFRNFSVYLNGREVSVPGAYSYVGYGVSSKEALINKYGVEELNNESDYFEVGSGLPIPKNGTVMWNRGYEVSVSSGFGNQSSANYTFGSRVSLYEPNAVNISTGEREVFVGWKGSGFRSYTGNSTSATVVVYGKITESAVWQLQYFVNVSSNFSNATGSGWYDNNSLVRLGINSSELYANSSTRYVFDGWTTANKTYSGNYISIKSPVNVTAVWKTEYFLNLSSEYGSVTGSGWYANRSIANFSLNFTNISSSDGGIIGFYSWSNGYHGKNGSLEMNKGYDLRAGFLPMVHVILDVVSEGGQNVSFSSIEVDNMTMQRSTYLPLGDNYMGSIDVAGYKMPLNRTVSIAGAGTIKLVLPVYPVLIKTTNFYGGAVNASLKLGFDNGTTSNVYSGRNGSYMMEYVPYGKVSGIAVYRGESIPFEVAYGVGGKVSFDYGESYLIFGIILAMLTIIAYLTVKHLGW